MSRPEQKEEITALDQSFDDYAAAIIKGSTLDHISIPIEVLEHQREIMTIADHDSSHYENTFYYTHRFNLAKVAIDAKNLAALFSLRAQGIDSNVCYYLHLEHVRGYCDGGLGMVGSERGRDQNVYISEAKFSIEQYQQPNFSPRIRIRPDGRLNYQPQTSSLFEHRNEETFSESERQKAFKLFYDDDSEINFEWLDTFFENYYNSFETNDYQQFCEQVFNLNFASDNDIESLLSTMLKKISDYALLELGEETLNKIYKKNISLARLLIRSSLDIGIFNRNRDWYDSFQDIFEEYDKEHQEPCHFDTETESDLEPEYPDDEKETKTNYDRHSFTDTKLIRHATTTLYAFNDEKQSISTAYRWQQHTANKFFRVGRSMRQNGQAQIIYSHLKKNNGMRLDNQIYYRSLIIALAKIISEKRRMPGFTFIMGSTTLLFLQSEQRASQRQIANFKMEIKGLTRYPIKYGQGLIKRLNQMTVANFDKEKQKKRWKKLLTLFKNRIKKVKPITLCHLNKYGLIRLTGEDSATGADYVYQAKHQKNADLLNGLIMLITVVEVLNRLYRTAEGNLHHYNGLQCAQDSDAFPVAIAQAQALILLISGKITFNDFVGESKTYGDESDEHRAQYGAVTGQGTIDNQHIMRSKLRTISQHCFDKMTANSPIRKKFISEQRSQNRSCFVYGRTMLRGQLGFVYGDGNESDSSDSEYSDDEATTSLLNAS